MKREEVRRKVKKGARRVGKTLFFGVCVACVGVTCLSFYAAIALKNAYVVAVERSVYFLVGEGEALPVSLSGAYASGGAGYEWKREDGRYAVYACYLGEDAFYAATNACETLSIEGKSVRVIEERFGSLSFATRAQKRDISRVKTLLDTVRVSAETLGLLAKRAQEGELRQKDLTAACAAAAYPLKGAAREGALGKSKALRACADEANEASEKLTALSENIVCARDLRAVQAALCAAYGNLCRAYGA